MDIRLAAEPGHLALGVVAVSLLGSLQSLFAREFSVQELHCLFVSEGSQWTSGIAVLLKQKLRLFDHAPFEHLLCAAVNAVIQSLTIGIKAKAQDAEAAQWVSSLLPEVCHRLA